MPWTDITWRGW